jgi:hypothetical protein
MLSPKKYPHVHPICLGHPRARHHLALGHLTPPPRVPHLAPGRLTPPSPCTSTLSCATQCRPSPLRLVVAAIHHSASICVSPSGHGMHQATTTPAPLGEDSRWAGTLSHVVGRRHHGRRTYMLQMHVLSVSDVSEVCCKCFIWILQK